MKKNLLKLSFLSLSALGLINCQKISQGDKAPADQTLSHAGKKWEEFRKALKLPADKPLPTEYLKPENAGEYQALVSEAATRLTQNTWATRCAAIEDIFPHPHNPVASDLEGHELKAKVYIMKYRLQKNKAGDPEDQVRSGILTIPDIQDEKTYPLLAFAHGDDNGLSYDQIKAGVGTLQEDYLVLAPTFPGEPLSDIGPEVVGESKPWENDVDELLGMHNCLTNYVQYRVSPELDETMFPVKNGLEVILGEADRFTFHHNYVAFPPKSVVIGVSRGGLVATLALAKAGAMLMALEKTPKLLDSFLNREDASKYMKEIGEALNSDKVGPGLPMFSGAATISSPSSVTVGQFRYVLEQIVKGHGEQTVAKDRPGIRKLIHIFDDYLNDKESVDEVKFKIILRDMIFLNPLITAALKNWHNPLLPGSLLLMHGTGDRVVPDDQTQAAANVMVASTESPIIKNQTLSPLGLNTWVRIFEKNSDESVCKEKDSFHANQCFYKSMSLLPEKYFSLSASRAFLHPESGDAAMMYAYSLYAKLQLTEIMKENYPGKDIFLAMLDEMDPILDDTLKKELLDGLKEIAAKNNESEVSAKKDRAVFMKEFFAKNAETIKSSNTLYLANQRKAHLNTIKREVLKDADLFSEDHLKDLFTRDFTSDDSLNQYYKENRKTQFAVESMLANGGLHKSSGDFIPLTSFSPMGFKDGEKGMLLQTEDQTPMEILKSWAARFTLQTPVLKD